MKRTAYFVLFSVTLVAGCQDRDYARHILVPDRTVGNLASTLCGSGNHVLKQKRIDSVGRVKQADGAELDVWVLRARKEPARGTVLLLHALGESKACYLPLGERLAGMGFDVALIDLRAHGDSGGKYCTFGAREAGEVKLVADTLLEPKSVHAPLYAFGPGLGGSVAIQYAALDDRCKGVLAMTPYKDFRSAGRRMLFPIAPAMSTEHFEEIVAEAGKMAEFDPNLASAVLAAAKLKCPLLLVHGWFDLAVPMDDSQEILKAAPGPKKLIDITPVLEQILLQATRDQWVADQLDKLAKDGLAEK